MNSKAFQLATDLTLAFVSTFVIIIAAWPATVTVQEVQCRTGDEAWTSYCLAIDDPDLKRLRQVAQQTARQQAADPETTVLASWRKQLADHYANLDQSRLELQQQLTENKVALLRPEPSQHLFTLSDSGIAPGGVTSKSVAADRAAAFSKAAFRLPTADQLTIDKRAAPVNPVHRSPVHHSAAQDQAAPNQVALGNTADTSQNFAVPNVAAPSVTVPNVAVPSAGLNSDTSQDTASGASDSFVQLPPAPAPVQVVETQTASAPRSAGAAYWQSVAKAASNPLAIGGVSGRLDVRFLKPRKQSWSPLAFQVALLLGLVVAVGFKAWSIKSPRIAGQPFFAQPQQVIGRWATLTVLAAIGFVVSTTLLG
ncbi:hypothetical protein SV7mr_34860 [Stieleria bergensis]|uniref:Uncharacterized protein n=1 Tax=Stieleria bergensis TaxID=2528025 RepID=A0A517SXT3_9BACT|nr:hypothetical protein SV7mr_34860 [Planctomycetes bacterium SV_7m_r]